MKRYLPLLIILLLFILASLLVIALPSEIKNVSKLSDEKVSTPSAAPTSSPSLQSGEQTGKADEGNLVLVTRVVDGDTIEIEGGQKVRYIGIDTPEVVDPREPVQCFGKEASAKNKELVEGKKVRLEKDVSETDKYNRLLRYIYIPSTSSGQELFINEYLVKEGFAFSSTYPPDVKYQNLFVEAQKQAQENNKGLWASCQGDSSSASGVSSPTSGCTIKGNISSSGEKIYHLPGQKYYNQTVIDETKGEKWFCSEEESTSAGWRKSKI